MSKVTTPKTPSVEEGEEFVEEQEKEEVQKKDKHTLSWTDQIESLLSGWADTAAVYKWLHDKSHRKYKRKNKFLTYENLKRVKNFLILLKM